MCTPVTFIKVPRGSNNDTQGAYVNLSQVTSMDPVIYSDEKDAEIMTYIYTSNNKCFKVKKTPEQILNTISGKTEDKVNIIDLTA
jgi:hypothetical protein